MRDTLDMTPYMTNGNVIMTVQVCQGNILSHVSARKNYMIQRFTSEQARTEFKNKFNMFKSSQIFQVMGNCLVIKEAVNDVSDIHSQFFYPC